jgi:ribosomal protein S6--L-glutamate ligase
MRLVVIGSPGAWHVVRIRAEAESRGHEVEVVEWRQLGAFIAPARAAVGRESSPPERSLPERFLPDTIETADAVIVRGMPAGRLEEVILRMDLLGRLAERGTPVINSPRALETAIDKYLSLARLAAAGIRVPRTIVTQDPVGIRHAWESLGGDAVVKPLFGSCGRGIERIDSEALLLPLLAAAAASPEGVATYLQEFIPHPGWDVRILLVGDEAFSLRRRSATDWRTNLARGGIGERFAPPAAWLDLARQAAAILGVEVAGVDLVPDAAGEPLVLEVNAVPGWRGLASATSLDPTPAVIRWAEQRAGQIAGAKSLPASDAGSSRHSAAT